MDLAIYINELLGLQGEVNVPGVGYFAQKRIAGHYNEHENKFYPPRHEIIFDPEPRDDNGLAAYISTKKNISPASAKYFIEKYTSGLKLQASEQQADIPGLGQLYYEYSALTFRPDRKFEQNDPSFYGFSPVKTHKGGGHAVVIEAAAITVGPHAIKTPEVIQQRPAAIIPPPVAEQKPEAVIPVPAAGSETEEPADDLSADEPATPRTFIPPPVYVDDEPDDSGRSIWIVILLIVIIVLLIFGIAYQYNPGLFSLNSREDTTTVVKTIPAAAKTDSALAVGSKKDTSSKSTTPAQTINRPIDTFAVVRYELLGGAFPTENTVNAQIQKYQKMGLTPRILKHATGKLYKITLGTFFTEGQGINAKDSILKATGISAKDIYLQRFIPQKK